MLREKLLGYFKENEEVFNEVIEELDAYNGYLGDDRYYEMEMIDEFALDAKPSEIIQRIYFGYDADTSTDELHTEFNPMRNYFYFNGYGNPVSSDYKDYSDKLDDWFIDELLENANNLYLPDEVEEMLYNIQEDEKETIEA